VGMPGAGEVTFEVLAFPINPADVMFCRGAYRIKPPLPATPGAECVGRVLAIGEGVSYVAPGDLVINLQRENCAQRQGNANELIADRYLSYGAAQRVISVQCAAEFIR